MPRSQPPGGGPDRLASSNNVNASGAAAPILAIVDAATDKVLQIITTTPGDHSVAVDPISKEIFLPVAANAADPTQFPGVPSMGASLFLQMSRGLFQSSRPGP
jgi:hypothetical protein